MVDFIWSLLVNMDAVDVVRSEQQQRHLIFQAKIVPWLIIT